MNINVPKNLKSPTVIVIGQPAERVQKRPDNLDMLEKKMDMQFKAISTRLMQKPKPEPDHYRLYKMLLDKLEKISSENREYLSKVDKDRVAELRKNYALMYKLGNQKPIENKINSLEEAIKNFKPIVKVVNNSANGNSKMVDSFNSALEKIQRAIEKSRPRLIPDAS